VSFAADPAGATTAVHGVVFGDDNANGRRDVGERVIGGAVVRVGEASAVSDERGVFIVSGLASDRMVRLVVDSASVEDEGYVPGDVMSVLLVSRAIARVDIPLRRIGAASRR
jgi:outer membrane usher protein FimD/PapC